MVAAGTAKVTTVGTRKRAGPEFDGLLSGDLRVGDGELVDAGTGEVAGLGFGGLRFVFELSDTEFDFDLLNEVSVDRDSGQGQSRKMSRCM